MPDISDDALGDLAIRFVRIKQLTDQYLKAERQSPEARALAEEIEREITAAHLQLHAPEHS